MTANLVGFAGALLLKATCILACGLLLALAMRRMAAEVRHLVLLVTIGSAIALPIVLLAVPRWSLPLLPADGSPSRVLGAPAAAATNSLERSAPMAARQQAEPLQSQAPETARAADRDESPFTRWPDVVLAGWMIGVALVALRLGVGQARLRAIRASARAPGDATWSALLNAERSRMGVEKDVRLLVSHGTTTPVTWGAREPVILLPIAAREWPVAQREAVIRHELAHIVRGDAQAQWMAALACVIYWFHPLAWLAAHRLRAECESACDDRVLTSGMPAGEYAEHLLSVARASRLQGGLAFLAVGMARPSQLAGRIRAVLDASRQRLALAPRTRAVTVVAGSLVLLALAACDVVARADAQPASTVMGRQAIEQGVPVITHNEAALRNAKQFTVEATPLAMMQGGAAGSADDLRWVRDAELLPDGRVAAFRSIDPTIFIFATNGSVQRRIGSLGRAPGEFMAPSGMSLLGGDTLYVPDGANARVNWIRPDHGFIHTSPMPATGPGRGPFMAPNGRVTGSGIVMASQLVIHEAGDSVTRNAVPILLADPLLTDVRTIGTVPSHDMTRFVTNYRGQRRTTSMPLRLGRFFSVVAWDTLIAVASGERGYEIEQWSVTGKVVARLRVERPRRATTQGMRDAQIALELARVDHPQREAYVDIEETRRQARERPFADSLAPHGQLFATRQHTLWVLDVIAPGDSGWTATAFRRDGVIVGRLSARGSSTPLYIGDDRVIVRGDDGSGRVSLRMHRIIPAVSGL